MTSKLPNLSLSAWPRQAFMRLMDLLSRYGVEQEDLVGVDITSNHIRVAQLTEKRGQWILEKLGYRHLELDTPDLNANADSLADRLRELVASSKITTPNAALSIPITSAIVRVITVPLLTDEELSRAVETNSLWTNTLQLADLDQYSIFWQTIRRHSSNNTMDILFVASKLADIHVYTNIASKAGLNPVIIDVRCFATRNAFKLMPALLVETGVNAVLQIGSDENYLLIIHNDAPFISDIYLSEQDRAVLDDASTDESAISAVCERYVAQVKQAILAFQRHALPSSKTASSGAASCWVCVDNHGRHRDHKRMAGLWLEATLATTNFQCLNILTSQGTMPETADFRENGISGME